MLTCEHPKGRDGFGKKVGPLTFFGSCNWPSRVAGCPAHSAGSTVDSLLGIMATRGQGPLTVQQLARRARKVVLSDLNYVHTPSQSFRRRKQRKQRA